MTTITPQAIPEVLLIEPQRFGDERGFFSETYSAKVLAAAGFDAPFVQDNHSRSPKVGTVRGLHFQAPPFAQDKLLRVTRGAILDVAVDIRTGSPTYGQSVAVELSAQNWRQLLVPKGFAHGFQTLADDTEVLYLMGAMFEPAAQDGVRWDDPAFGIAWPLPVATISARDAGYPDYRG
jgi:dTDP-4-dehydrorhamnose 3,5-epimerase